MILNSNILQDTCAQNLIGNTALLGRFKCSGKLQVLFTSTKLFVCAEHGAAYKKSHTTSYVFSCSCSQVKTFRYVTPGYSAAVLILMCFDINMCLLAPISRRATTQQNSGKSYCTYFVKSDCFDTFWILS